jgi:hypothetical protein
LADRTLVVLRVREPALNGVDGNGAAAEAVAVN